MIVVFNQLDSCQLDTLEIYNDFKPPKEEGKQDFKLILLPNMEYITLKVADLGPKTSKS